MRILTVFLVISNFISILNVRRAGMNRQTTCFKTYLKKNYNKQIHDKHISNREQQNNTILHTSKTHARSHILLVKAVKNDHTLTMSY